MSSSTTVLLRNRPNHIARQESLDRGADTIEEFDVSDIHKNLQ